LDSDENADYKDAADENASEEDAVANDDDVRLAIM